MFKRAARVLFIGGSGDWRTDLAVRLMGEIGAGWMEGRGVDLDRLDAEQLAWADLVIPLDVDTRQRCPALPPTARLKVWDLPELPPEETEAEIRRRLTSMLGGLRMLSRVDGK
ncbi:hypothetical protein [Thioalkalivibrio sulfidiphilus]|uniref:hypothetical protein n=1 Tax=Thioalkalivibrio sulfidiphilus TaxID=1033854 RepID=UPI000360629E|nr:hypothetical protein [Thioalkalivibrio sulfidiphilus]